MGGKGRKGKGGLGRIGESQGRIVMERFEMFRGRCLGWQPTKASSMGRNTVPPLFMTEKNCRSGKSPAKRARFYPAVQG